MLSPAEHPLQPHAPKEANRPRCYWARSSSVKTSICKMQGLSWAPRPHPAPKLPSNGTGCQDSTYSLPGRSWVKLWGRTRGQQAAQDGARVKCLRAPSQRNPPGAAQHSSAEAIHIPTTSHSSRGPLSIGQDAAPPVRMPGVGEQKVRETLRN